jgi:uncharacterized OsmC-like protein
MVEVQVEHLGSVQFEVKARQHTIVCDQPAEAGGFDEGMTPPELLLASVGTCAGYYAAQYLRKHQLAGEGTRVRVTADKVKGPARLDNFNIEVTVPIALTEEHKRGVEQEVGRCLIKNTLAQSPTMQVSVKPGALAAGA